MLDSFGLQWLDSGSGTESEYEIPIETDGEVTVESVNVYDAVVPNADVNNNSDQNNTCAICEKQFSSRSNLNKHIKRKHGDVEFRCFICNNIFKTENDFKITSHSSDPFQCEVCSKLYKTKSALKMHLNKHYDNHKFFCHFCGKGFFRKFLFDGHVAKQTGVKTCEKCDKKFQYSTNLKRHAKCCNKNAERYACKKCARHLREMTI
jgi:hypothetical protein